MIKEKLISATDTQLNSTITVYGQIELTYHCYLDSHHQAGWDWLIRLGILKDSIGGHVRVKSQWRYITEHSARQAAKRWLRRLGIIEVKE